MSRSRYLLEIEAEPHEIPAANRWRRFLKMSLRVFNIRCISIAEKPAEQAIGPGLRDTNATGAWEPEKRCVTPAPTTGPNLRKPNAPTTGANLTKPYVSTPAQEAHHV